MAASQDAPKESEDFFSLVGQAFKMIDQSWEALKLNIVTFVLVILVPAVLFIVAAFMNLAVNFAISPDGYAGGSTIGQIISWLIMLAAIVVALIFLPAITITQLESVKGKKVEFKAVFEKSKKYVLRYVGLMLLGGLIAVVPAVLLALTIFLIPLAIAWFVIVFFFLVLAPYLLIDKDKGVIDTLKLSYEVTKMNWKWVLATYIVLCAINLPSIIPFVGSIVSLVLSIAYFCLVPIVYVKKIKV